MSVTLNTQFGELMFSSQISDIDLSTSDDGRETHGARGDRVPVRVLIVN